MPTVVIINADDYAYHPAIDQAILLLARQAVINSLSVIVNTARLDEAAREVREMWAKHPQMETSLSVGLHFNLTEGKPLSKAIGQSCLTQDGQFFGKPKIYQITEEQSGKLGELVSEELQAQVRRFVEAFGRMPSHVDGHNHIHIVPGVAEAVANTMRKIGIYRTRIPLEKLQKVSLPINNMFLKYASQAKKHYQDAGILFAMEFVGLESFGKHCPSLLQQAIARQQENENGSVELMCHPGLPTEQGPEWVKSEDRFKETQQLSSPEYSQLRTKENYYSLKAVSSSQQRYLICYGQKQYYRALLAGQKLEKQGIKVYFWMKEAISEHFSRVDLQSLITSIPFAGLIEIERSSEVAQSLSLPCFVLPL